MFQAGLLLIIRGTTLYIQQLVHVMRLCWLLLAGSGGAISRCTVNRTLQFTYTPTCYGVLRQILTRHGNT
jgi:hypothetical protein